MILILYITLTILMAILVLFLRGDRLHNYLVLESQEILKDGGFETFQEHPEKLPCGSTNFIDLLAKNGDLLICIEIETSARYALDNAVKAQHLKLPLVVVVPNRSIKKSVQIRFGKSNIKPGGCDIYILLLSQLKQEVMKCFPLFSAVNTNRKTKK